MLSGLMCPNGADVSQNPKNDSLGHMEEVGEVWHGKKPLRLQPLLLFLHLPIVSHVSQGEGHMGQLK